jgi:hypothetical protein
MSLSSSVNKACSGPHFPLRNRTPKGFPAGPRIHTRRTMLPRGPCIMEAVLAPSNQQSQTNRVKQNSIDTCARNTYTLRKHATQNIPFPLAHLACTTPRVLTNQRTRGERMCVCVCVCVCLCVCITMTASRLPSLQKNHHTYLQASHSHHRRRRHRFKEWVVLV